MVRRLEQLVMSELFPVCSEVNNRKTAGVLIPGHFRLC